MIISKQSLKVLSSVLLWSTTGIIVYINNVVFVWLSLYYIGLQDSCRINEILTIFARIVRKRTFPCKILLNPAESCKMYAEIVRPASFLQDGFYWEYHGCRWTWSWNWSSSISRRMKIWSHVWIMWSICWWTKSQPSLVTRWCIVIDSIHIRMTPLKHWKWHYMLLVDNERLLAFTLSVLLMSLPLLVL